MKDYISTIIYICIFSVILELILPENKLKKYVSVLVALIILLVTLSPLINVLEDKNIVTTVSSALENITNRVKGKTETYRYDFEDYKDKIVFSNVKGELEQEILNSCKEKFRAPKVLNVKIDLNEDYNISKLNIYVDKIEEIHEAYNIIEYLQEKYNIKNNIINVIEEE